MVLETLLGGLLGGAARLAPEVLKFLDRKGERSHELALQDKQHELLRIQGQTRLDQTHAEVDGQQFTTAVQALQAAVAAQAVQTGIKWVDAASALVRPIVTYVMFAFYGLAKLATYVQVMASGLAWDSAILTIWGVGDMAMLNAILSFWFLGRVLDKVTR